MKVFVWLTLVAALPAQADFSYKVTRKTSGMMAGAMNAQPSVSTTYYKGQKLKTDNGNTATILDFDARTITTINNTAKTVSVRSFDDIKAAANTVDAKIDVKETGQTKPVNGFNASETVMTMEVEPPAGRGAQMGKMQMEMDLWLSADVPGSQQVADFYKKNGPNFPWAAMMSGASSSVSSATADAQRRMATMRGVPVQTIMRIKAPGMSTPAMPQLSAAQGGQMEQARARMAAMAAQGGPQGQAAKDALARMDAIGGARGGAAASGGALMETISDSSDFSSASIPDSVFAIPAGYQKAN